MIQRDEFKQVCDRAFAILYAMTCHDYGFLSFQFNQQTQPWEGPGFHWFLGGRRWLAPHGPWPLPWNGVICDVALRFWGGWDIKLWRGWISWRERTELLHRVWMANTKIHPDNPRHTILEWCHKLHPNQLDSNRLGSQELSMLSSSLTEEDEMLAARQGAVWVTRLLWVSPVFLGRTSEDRVFFIQISWVWQGQVPSGN